MTRSVDPYPGPDPAHTLPTHFFTDLVTSASDAVMAMDRDGRVTFWNRGCEQLFGWSAEQMLGHSVELLLPEDRREELARMLGALTGEAECAALETVRLTKSGEMLPVSCRLSPIVDRDGEVYGACAVVRENGREMELRRQVEQARQLAEARFTQSVVAQVTMDSDAAIVAVNPALCRLSGYTEKELLGRPVTDFMVEEELPDIVASLVRLRQGESSESRRPRLLRHAEGHFIETRVSIFSIRDEQTGEVLRLEAIVEDVSATMAAERALERRAAEAVLQELAGLDSLTGLATRAPLMAALDGEFAAGQAAQTAVAILDITRFKLVNDTYGHRSADDVLSEVAGRLLSASGERDVVARLGGDRFAVMLPGVDDVDGLRDDVDALLTAIGEPIELDAGVLTVTASVGAAIGPAVDSGTLLTAAESALQAVKGGTEGPVHVVSGESRSTALTRARLVEDLRRGLDRDELVVHFQPVVSLVDGRLASAEALVRWQHPDRGLLNPADFIDAAEESGLIVEVGTKVLTEACRAAAGWRRLGSSRRPFHVAVNLSAKQLTAGNVVEVIRDCLAASGAEPANLMLEVTESAVMADVESAGRRLQELRALGVSIAVDDFGTGYSSLTYLKRFPVTTLKIDRSFVSGLGQNSDDAAIVASTVSLTRAMALDCVAEGVETDQQRLVLQALGCGYAQGFLWSPAVDAEEFDRWARERAKGTGALPGEKGWRSGPAKSKAAARVPVAPAVIERAKVLQASGASAATIAAALNSEQVGSPTGKRWSARSVSQLLVGRPRE